MTAFGLIPSFFVIVRITPSSKPIANEIIPDNRSIWNVCSQLSQVHGYESFGKLFSNELRAKLKVKHLDLSALDLFERELKFWSEHNAEFQCVKDAGLGE